MSGQSQGPIEEYIFSYIKKLHMKTYDRCRAFLVHFSNMKACWENSDDRVSFSDGSQSTPD
jgi:hypothetical protein